MRACVVRKWPLRGRSRFVCWNITRLSLWLLCNVHFVQSTQRTIATWPRWPKGTDQYSSEEYGCTHVDACVARNWISYRCVPCHPWCTHRTSLIVRKKTFPFSCGCEQFHWARSFGFLVINVCYHGEHYETPCIEEEKSHIRSLIFVGFRWCIYYVHDPQTISRYRMCFSGLEDWESMPGKGEGVSVLSVIQNHCSLQ